MEYQKAGDRHSDDKRCQIGGNDERENFFKPRRRDVGTLSILSYDFERSAGSDPTIHFTRKRIEIPR